MFYGNQLYVANPSLLAPMTDPSLLFLCPRATHLASLRARAHDPVPGAEVDPVQNTDTLAGVEDEDLSFPFVATTEDVERVQSKGLTNST